ncbi:hypothetical protein WMY93_023084 [Mugilogobius chulae]|uniref:Uncharacterized protein n=1 Tax=Mugilogobius chulae TaxID=88201 RepID=A0AAW0N6E0_9GOBI
MQRLPVGRVPAVRHNPLFVWCDPDLSAAIINPVRFMEGALRDDWIRDKLECDPGTVKVQTEAPQDTNYKEHTQKEKSVCKEDSLEESLQKFLLLLDQSQGKSEQKQGGIFQLDDDPSFSTPLCHSIMA